MLVRGERRLGAAHQTIDICDAWADARQKKIHRPLCGDGGSHSRKRLSVLAVVLGVMPARFGVVMLGMAGMTMGAVRVMRRLVVVAGFVVLGGFAVMTRRVLVMLSCLVVMLNACVVAHGDLPVWRIKSAILMQER